MDTNPLEKASVDELLYILKVMADTGNLPPEASKFHIPQASTAAPSAESIDLSISSEDHVRYVLIRCMT
jgi:hypothetical protein